MSESIVSHLAVETTSRAPITPPEAFAIDRDRRPSPYPGLEPFGEEDAAIFFGRDRELAEFFARVDAKRRAGDVRPLAIVGASGVGKRSFAYAGIKSRLTHDTGWPSEAPGHQGIDAPPVTFVDAARQPSAVLQDTSSMAIVTCTPAQWTALTTAGHDIERFDLRPIPRFRFDEIVAGPAQRYGVRVDPALTDAIIEDASPDDLAAVAFILRTMWLRRPSDGPLSGAAYYAAGRLPGIIETTCEQAFGPRNAAAAARVFVRRLLYEDSDGSLQSRYSARSAFDTESQPALDRLIAAGLVTQDPESDGLSIPQPAVFDHWFRVRQHTRRHPHHRKPMAKPSAAWAAILGSIALCIATTGLLAWGWWRWQLALPPQPVFAGYTLTEQQERNLKPGDTFRECRARCPEMVVVPAGQFIMGDKHGGDATLQPRHRVTFARPFAVGRTEVTFNQMLALLEETRVPFGEELEIAGSKPDHPANFLTQKHARRYAAWLSKKTGARYRLLTSAEWEYVARAGTQTAFTWGDEPGQGRMHCEDCGSPFETNGLATRSGIWVYSAPVASFAPNAFGLFDVHGNVWELVQDCYHPNYVGAPTDGSARTTPYRSDCRPVIRGGGLGGTGYGKRAAVRDWRTDESFDVGFRVARDLRNYSGSATASTAPNLP